MNHRARKWLALAAAVLALVSHTAPSKADARRLADLNPGSVGSFPSNFTTFSGQLFFSAYTLSTGRELWRYDGTNVTLVADINPTADDLGGVFEGNDSLPTGFRSFDGGLYFSAFDPFYGAELWRYQSNQVVRLTDINPDIGTLTNLPNSAWPKELTPFNGALYFSATSSTNPENYELWRYNTNGAVQAANLREDTGFEYSSYPIGLKVFAGSLYFSANDGTNGWELWRHDGTNTTMLDLNPGGTESSSYPKYFTPLNEHLYFQAYTLESGFELWKTDGTNALMVADYVAGGGSSYPEFLTPLNGTLYFRGTDPLAGFELLKLSDGQISVAADINPVADSYPENLTTFGNALLFSATDGVHGWELWKFDGTNATMLADINPVGDSFPENLIVTAGILYFTATSPETGYELWMYDGTTVSLAADAVPGKKDSFARNLSPINGKVYFSAIDNKSFNWEPWLFDPAFTNRPPSITLTAPQNGTQQSERDPVFLSATAADEFSALQVEFFAGDILLGSAASAPYTLTTNLPAGTFNIWAQAIDSSGATTASATATLIVTPVPPPEPSTFTREGDTTTVSLTSTTQYLHSLEASLDLVTWIQVATAFPIDGIVTLTHECAELQQFYRVVIP